MLVYNADDKSGPPLRNSQCLCASSKLYHDTDPIRLGPQPPTIRSRVYIYWLLFETLFGPAILPLLTHASKTKHKKERTHFVSGDSLSPLQ